MAAPHPVSGEETLRPWNSPQRFLFRFTFCYLALICLGLAGILRMFIIVFGFHREPANVLDPLWHRVIPWVGAHLLGFAPTTVSPGPNETLYDYVLLACQVALALGAALVWSLRDRRRTDYRALLAWLRRAVGLLLACVLFAYGTDKVFPLQFGTLSPMRLSERVGDLSPFTMLWTFMAASMPYTVFSGAMEVLAGLLLLSPRCEPAGALLSIGVMTNVFILNMAYDVPVKLISSHLLLCAIFLAACDAPRLAPALFSGRAVAERPIILLSRHAWINRGVAIAHPAAGFAILALFSVLMFHRYREREAATAHTPLYGVWSVDEFQVTGDPHAPLLTPKVAAALRVHPGEDHWQQLAVDSPRDAAVRLGNGVLDFIAVNVDAAGTSATFSDPGDPAWKCDFRIQRPANDQLRLEGRINGVPSSVLLHRLSTDMFRLTRDRFHWAQPAR